MRRQRTINDTVAFEGIGLHTGKYCSVRLSGLDAGEGIIFCKTGEATRFKIHIDNVIDTSNCTVIGTNGFRVGTVEHILSALSALDIDNIRIEVDGPEIPILDGSSIAIVRLLKGAGIVELDEGISYLKILQPYIYNKNGSSIRVEPSNGRIFSFRLHYPNNYIGEQNLSISITEETYADEIAPARTFGFLSEVDSLRARGLALGGSLDNAVVFSDTGPINEGGLRYRDECVRHKILDMIGDFVHLGMPIEGHVIADKSGHSLNIAFLRKLLIERDVWEIV